MGILQASLQNPHSDLEAIEMYDVSVVGAGPAGSVLAYLLARRGLQVLLLEKETLPRYKTCGGGVTLKALQNLPFDASSIFERQAVGGVLTYRGEEWMRVETGWPIAWLVMRGRFDQYLAGQAVAAGARLVEGVEVSGVEMGAQQVVVHTGQGDFTSRFLAGADGVNSRVAHSLELLRNRRVGTAIEAELAVPPAGLQAQGDYATFDFGALPHGYGWIFPKQEHLSVGVFRAAPGRAADLRSRLDAFIACQPPLRGAQVLHWRGHPIPLGGGRARLHQGRALLLGDAANLADPWLGEGIYYALVSARLAAAALWDAAQAGSADLAAYTVAVHRQLMPQFAYAGFFAFLVYLMPEFCSFLISGSRYMQDAVFTTMRGSLTLQQMATRVVVGSPWVLGQALWNGVRSMR